MSVVPLPPAKLSPALPPPAPKPEAHSASPAAATAAQDDAIAQLITGLEAQYQAALRLDRQGQLDEARLAFDATLDRLLASSYDIPATPRLQQELDSLLDRIQAIESDALAAGGLNQAPTPASPLDRIPEPTFPLDAATKARIEAESQSALTRSRLGELPLVLNDPVLHYIQYFTTRGKEDLLHGLARAGRYRDMIEKTFQQVGIPSDLIYLAQLESGFDPRQLSSAGARGMWQFMPSRAADYDLKRTHWLDLRMDPEAATAAAAHHLKDLYSEFGDWYLAMAAYNTGPATIQAIVARTGYADYFRLYDSGALPKSWRNYVPVILAMAIIADNPSQYGITVPDPDPPLAPDRVEIGVATDIRLAAECAGVTVADIQHLNPALLHYEAPPGYTLKLPQGTLGRYQEAIERVPPKGRIAWRMHWIKPGETWGQLSRRYHVSVGRLQTANHLPPGHAPLAGAPLALPNGRVLVKAPVKKKAGSGKG
ncbi:MAG TPA: transglycosylase SLT domain-containing protein [Terriglobales bacterium]|nr:transglycosylase SLT domain-containing protein [Terriglobales bacterium]